MKILLYLTTLSGLIALISHASVFDDFSALVNRIPMGQDVHILDPFVSQRAQEYLDTLAALVPVIPVENPYQECRDFYMTKFSPDDLYMNLNNQPMNLDMVKACFLQAINHLEKHKDLSFGQAKVTSLLQASLYYNRLADDPAGWYFFIIQMLDASGTCLQGQTNRLLLSVHYVWENNLRPLSAFQG